MAVCWDGIVSKLINDPGDVVLEGLEGTALIQPGITLLTGRAIAVRSNQIVTDANRGTVGVAVISGGGSGHEPAHAGYVADGMLAAAVAGGVFSSPSVDAVLDAIRTVTGDAGALLVVKSYTGDRLNFGLAAEIARTEGLAVEMVVVGDDVSLGDADTHAGRRGLAGTVLVHKAAGAMATAGKPLAEVAAVARRVAGTVRTMGVGLSACTVPGADGPGFELGDDEMELGLGIHGERGVERAPIGTADEVVATLVDRALDDLVDDDDAHGGGDPERTVLLLNNTGGTPPAELAIACRAALTTARRRTEVVRLWQGHVMTSLEMAGVSVSVLGVDDELLALLDAPTGSLAWPGAGQHTAPELNRIDPPVAATDAPSGASDPLARKGIDAACRAILDAEDDLTRRDQVLGDGDLGTALARGAKAWLDDPREGTATELLRHLSAVVRREVGGTSGPLYAVGLLRAAEVMQDAGSDNPWPQALRAGTDALMELGGAARGEKTMVDALDPAADAAVGAASDPLAAAIEAAEQGIADTVESTASKGRASYLGARSAGEADPGAVAVLCWLRALAG